MLSMETRYALKAMMDLAALPYGDSRSVAEIAESTGVPRKFLEAIVVKLKRHQLVESRRGKLGGYRLCRQAEEISFADIIRVTNGPIALIPCTSKYFYRPCADCPDEASCRLHTIMAAARDQILTVLEKVTLSEAVGTPDAFAQYMETLNA